MGWGQHPCFSGWFQLTISETHPYTERRPCATSLDVNTVCYAVSLLVDRTAIKVGLPGTKTP